MNDLVLQSTAIIQKHLNVLTPRVGVVLGSGLGPFADKIENPIVISYADLPGFPDAGVSGHAGELVAGLIEGTPVVAMKGRAHYYEDGKADVMKCSIHTLKEIGCETLLLTNASGSTLPEAGPGSVMLLSDHINFTGISPLFGEKGNDRFVDLTVAYDADHRNMISRIARDLDIKLHDGIYMWFSGPNFETPAEIRAAKVLGATAVGMSTVPEVIMARQVGMKVAALSIITNFAAGMSETLLSHEQTMQNAKIATSSVEKIMTGFLAGYGKE